MSFNKFSSTKIPTGADKSGQKTPAKPGQTAPAGVKPAQQAKASQAKPASAPKKK